MHSSISQLSYLMPNCLSFSPKKIESLVVKIQNLNKLKYKLRFVSSWYHAATFLPAPGGPTQQRLFSCNEYKGASIFLLEHYKFHVI